MTALPDVNSLKAEYESAVAGAQTADALADLRVAWLGRKGRLTLLLKELGTLTLEEKKKLGPVFNALKVTLEADLAERERRPQAAARNAALEQDTLDVTLPGEAINVGSLHPLAQVQEKIISVFRSMGFACADGPELESDFYNFEALNIPPNHPARDMQDTFYIRTDQQQLSLPTLGGMQGQDERTLLRTHTSPVQARIMQRFPPPIAIVAPGRVYRYEAHDATHSSVFHQMEGLLIDEGVSFADLKGTLLRFAQLMFAPTVRTRFKPSFFPFTEPSAQMDVSCWVCSGSGCRTCKHSGWIELLGAGMVNTKVLQLMNIDTERYSGFAFGMGIERIAMIKYGIEDIRLFFENDLRFLRQF